MNQEEGEAINAAFEKMAYKFISRADSSPTGSSTPCKAYTEVHAVNQNGNAGAGETEVFRYVGKQSR